MESPPGREGAPPSAPLPKVNHLPQSNSGVAIAQVWGHSNTVTERLPDGHLHYAQEIGATCRRHVKKGRPGNEIANQNFAYPTASLNCVWLAVPQPTKWQLIGNQIDTVLI